MPSKSARAGRGMIDDSQGQPNYNPHICNVTKINVINQDVKPVHISWKATPLLVVSLEENTIR